MSLRFVGGLWDGSVLERYEPADEWFPREGGRYVLAELWSRTPGEETAASYRWVPDAVWEHE
jgi:hypothetical protein